MTQNNPEQTQAPAILAAEPSAGAQLAAPAGSPQDSDIVAIQVSNSRGTGTRTLYKSKKTGKLVRNVRSEEKLSEDNHLRSIRRFLTEAETAIKKGDKSRAETVLDAMYELITKEKSEKTATARVNAARFLFESGYGRTNSDSELKTGQSPVRVVVIQPIENMMHPEPIDAGKLPPKPTRPAFIEAEVISTNPGPIPESGTK